MFQYPQFLNAILMYISSIVENSNSSLWSKVLIAKHKEQLKVNQLYTSVPKRVDNSFSEFRYLCLFSWSISHLLSYKVIQQPTHTE
jgi:hypothetical protein